MDVLNQFVNRARTGDIADDRAAEAEYKSSIDRQACVRFHQENQQNIGCILSSRGLTLINFLSDRLIKYEKSMFLTACTFLVLPLYECRKLAPVPF